MRQDIVWTSPDFPAPVQNGQAGTQSHTKVDLTNGCFLPWCYIQLIECSHEFMHLSQSSLHFFTTKVNVNVLENAGTEIARELLEIDREEGISFKKSFEKDKKVRDSRAWQRGWKSLQVGVGTASSLEAESRSTLERSGTEASSNFSSLPATQTALHADVNKPRRSSSGSGRVVRSPVDEAIKEVRELIAEKTHLYGIKIPLKLEWSEDDDGSEDSEVGSQLATCSSRSDGGNAWVPISNVGHQRATYSHDSFRFFERPMSGVSSVPQSLKETAAMMTDFPSLFFNRLIMVKTIRPILHTMCPREGLNGDMVKTLGIEILTGTVSDAIQTDSREGKINFTLGSERVIHESTGSDSSWVLSDERWRVCTRNQPYWVELNHDQCQVMSIVAPNYLASTPFSRAVEYVSVNSMDTAMGAGGSVNHLLTWRNSKDIENHSLWNSIERIWQQVHYSFPVSSVTIEELIAGETSIYPIFSRRGHLYKEVGNKGLKWCEHSSKMRQESRSFFSLSSNTVKGTWMTGIPESGRGEIPGRVKIRQPGQIVSYSMSRISTDKNAWRLMVELKHNPVSPFLPDYTRYWMKLPESVALTHFRSESCYPPPFLEIREPHNPSGCSRQEEREGSILLFCIGVEGHKG